jgi:hypothetical protein
MRTPDRMGKAVMLIWVVEPLLFEVCAPEREATGICGMITRSSRLLTAGSFPPQTDVSERLVGLIPIGVGLPKGTLRVLRSIFRASLLSELDTLLRDQSSFKRLSIKICLAGDKMGIRFNMHDGTLDTALAKIWARVCMAVVQNAMMDDEKFRELFRRTVRNMNWALDHPTLMGSGRGTWCLNARPKTVNTISQARRFCQR